MLIKRKNKLITKLRQYKLELRNDSKLCQGYISGSIKDWDIDDIVNRMCQIHYLFNYCNMNKYIKQANDEQNEEFNAGYIPDISVFDQAEMIVLKEIGEYPEIWPWI